VMRLAKFLGRSPDTVSGVDLRRFQRKRRPKAVFTA
jgi:hypothetical protein